MRRVDLSDLRAKAEAATPGPWVTEDPGEVRDAETGKAVVNHIGRHPIEGNTLFVAAANPAVVIALLDRIEQLENELARASGVTRAKGETAYADDYMEIAKRLQRMAWRRLLRLPRKQRLLDIDTDGPHHPSELCRCAGVLVDPDTAAHAVDHKPDCLWLVAMCKACEGTGCCPTCHGDGCDPRDLTTPQGEREFGGAP